MRISRVVGSATAIACVVASFVSTNADARSRRPQLNLETLDSFIEEQGLDAAKAANPGMSIKRIAESAGDPAAHVDSDGALVWVDSPLRAGSFVPNSIPPSYDSVALDDFLSLNSRPGSNRTIFLDFDGHTVPTGTAWDPANPGEPVVAGTYPAFTIDGDPAFNDTEKNYIIAAWAAVAEDYSIFDVNVTTEDPGDAAIDRVNISDQIYGTRALISQGISTWDSAVCGCGGIAYGDVFNLNPSYGAPHAYAQPAFIFSSGDYQSPSGFDGKLLADVASHEVGHNLNLAHDGIDRAGEEEYFQGFDDGINWAPIMGAGYYNGIVQWSNGDYSASSNTENDVSLISAAGAPFLTDESNTSIATATTISSTPTDGVINSAADKDYFKVIVSAGSLGVYSYAPTTDPNLDASLSLYDANGKLIFSSDPPSAQAEISSGAGAGMAPWPVTGMSGVLDAVLPNGTYYVAIDGVGRTGAYSDYGSIGSYSIVTRAPSVGAIPAAATPSITGTRRKGKTLTANYGTWSTGVTFTKQWLRDGVAITGATGKTYRLTRSDVGHKISVRIVGSKAGKSTAIKVSAKTKRITN